MAEARRHSRHTQSRAIGREICSRRRRVLAQPLDLIFELDIADIHGGWLDEGLNGFLAVRGADHVDDVSAGIDQDSADRIGNAFFVGDAEDEDRLAGEL